MSIRDEANPLVLILSADAIAAALLGGLVELLGYRVQFASIEEGGDADLRRVRPRIYMVDCESGDGDVAAALGHARMRGIGMVLLGPPALFERMRELAGRHGAEVVFMPPDPVPLGEALSRAAKRSS